MDTAASDHTNLHFDITQPLKLSHISPNHYKTTFLSNCNTVVYTFLFIVTAIGNGLLLQAHLSLDELYIKDIAIGHWKMHSEKISQILAYIAHGAIYVV